MYNLCSILATSILVLCSISFAVDPSGTWKMTMEDPEGNEMVASVTFADGTYQGDFGMDGTIEVQGTYTIDGDQLTMQDDVEKTTAAACENAGSYTVSIDGDAMSLSLVSDACEGRSTILNGMTMMRQ